MNKMQSFYLGLEGEATKRGQLDISYIGHLYTSIDVLVNESNKELKLFKSRLQLIEKETREGSWITEVVAQYPTLSNTINFFGNETVVNLMTFFTALGFTKYGLETIGKGARFVGKNIIGLFELVKKLKGREISVIDIGEGYYSISFKDMEDILISEETLKLYSSKGVRKALKNVVSILYFDGLSDFLILEDFKVVNTSIKKKDISYFDYSDELPVESRFTDYKAKLNIKRSVNQGDSQWKFSYKGKTIDANIIDSEWLDSYQSGRIYFPATAILIVDLEIISSSIDKKIEGTDMKYRVLKVHAEVYSKEQYSLLSENTDNEKNE